MFLTNYQGFFDAAEFEVIDFSTIEAKGPFEFLQESWPSQLVLQILLLSEY